MSIVDILAPWTAVNDALGLATPIRDAAHHAELLAFVDEAFERFGGDDAHPIFGLVSIGESGDRPRYAGESAGVHNQVQHHLLTLERELLHRGNRYCHLSSEERACIMLR